MIGVVVSKADEASVAIGEALLDLADWITHEDPVTPAADGGGSYHRTPGAELRRFDEFHIHLEGAADPFTDIDCLVFASRHAGETGPLLTAHFTGNFGPAEYGGDPGALSRAATGAQRVAVDALREHAPDGYDVSIECTHHGPSDLDVPSLFVEVGSGPDEWEDQAAATAAGEAILALRDVEPLADRTVAGFGGGHYAPRFLRVLDETDHALGHIAADWALEAVEPSDESVLRRAFERSGATRALLDGVDDGYRSTIEDLGYRVVGERWLREVTGIPLERVEAVESAICSVEEGLRFGERAAAEAFTVRRVDQDLLSDLNGIDAGAVRDAVAAQSVAFVTAENGNRVVGPVAFAGEEAYHDLVDAFVAILEDAYESVKRIDGHLVVRERAFDPERARGLGVEEGPAYGRLAGGSPVEVDGRRITPDEVHVDRTNRYPI